MKEDMPVREFVKLCKEAEKCHKRGDMKRFEAINEKLKPLGYAIVMRDGKSYLKQEAVKRS